MVSVSELYNSRKLGKQSGSIKYLARGTTDLSEALGAVLTQREATFSGFYPEYPVLDSWVERPDALADDLFFFTQNYTPANLTSTDPTNGTITWSSDFRLENQRIKHSLATTAYGEDAPDFGGLINVSGAGAEQTVEGVDIGFPVGSYVGTFRAPDTVINDAWRKGVLELVGTVCSYTFRNHPSGEVRFTGFSDRQVFGADGFDYEATFEFAYSQNLTGATIAGIEGVDKEGWQYLWVYYKRTEDDGKPSVTPAGVYVETLYEKASWAAMGSWAAPA